MAEGNRGMRNCLVCASIMGALTPAVASMYISMSPETLMVWLQAILTDIPTFVISVGIRVLALIPLVFFGYISAMYIARPQDAAAAFMSGIAAPALVISVVASANGAAPSATKQEKITPIGTKSSDQKQSAVSYVIGRAVAGELVVPQPSAPNSPAAQDTPEIRLDVDKIVNKCSGCNIVFFDSNGVPLTREPLNAYQTGNTARVYVPRGASTAQISGFSGINAASIDVENALSATQGQKVLELNQQRNFSNDFLTGIGKKGVMPYDLTVQTME